jgi:hydroxyquinol 1,2-dioxygenase
MRNLTESNLTEAVLAKLATTEDARFRQIAESLVRHLHEFVREVELTEDEWLKAILFLTAVGHKCDDKRQEFILLSDTLGVSMLVDAINHRYPEGSTETTVFGPFYQTGAPEFENGANIAEGVAGKPTYFSGRVLDEKGVAVAGAIVDIWAVDGEGWYDVQLAHLEAMQVRGRLKTDDLGRFWFWTVKPVSYPVPSDGPVGDMLRAMGRHPYRPAHIHFMLSAPGYRNIITHVFVAGDGYLDSDVVFGVKSSLVTEFTEHAAGRAPDGTVMQTPYFVAEYDFHLARENS